MAEVLIDLGDLDRERPSARVEEALAWARPPRRQVRRIVSVIVAVVAALLVGPGTVPLPARFAAPVRIPGSGADEFLLAGDLVIVHSGYDRQLRAYDLSGSLRWATAVPLAPAGPDASVSGVLLVSGPTRPGELVALDLGTGEIRWAAAGVLYALADGVVVLGRGDIEFETGEVHDLVGLDPVTGARRWRQEVRKAGPGERWLDVYGLRYRHAARALIRADGRGEVLDLTTGRWLGITGVPAAPPEPKGPVPPGTATGYQVAVRSGGVTIVFTAAAEPADGAVNVEEPGRLVAYGPSFADPLWTVGTGTWAPAIPCGPWVCLAAGDSTRVLDRATGAEVRRVGWPHVVSGANRRFLGYDSAGAVATTQIAVFDATTGRALHHHLGWDLVSRDYADWLPIMRRGRGLEWQLATLSMDSGTAYPLGTFDAAGEHACQNTATHVACSVRSGEIMIWRHVPSR